MGEKKINGSKVNGKGQGKARLVAAEAPASQGLSAVEAYRGRHVLMTGVTGFLGKVVAAMLLDRHPDLGQLYLLVRPGGGMSAQERYEKEFLHSRVLDPVRQRWSDGFEAFMAEKVTVLAGDVADPNYGITDEATLAKLREDLDLILNSAGLTSFTPGLDQALGVNTQGPQYALAFVTSCRKAALAHVSTTYVTGTRDGLVREDEDPYGFYPRREELKITFDPAQEVADCRRAMEAIKLQADDQKRKALFTRLAHESLAAQNRNPNDPAAFEERFNHERRKWVREALREEGKRRAAHWGWTNTYTYSKSLGEQLMMHQLRAQRASGEGRDVAVSIIRPAIIESSVTFPVPGWNQGVNTSAPISFLFTKGVRFVPTTRRARLDVVPVDFVSAAIVSVGAALMKRVNEPLYQLGSSQRNPISVRRIVELTTLWNRRHASRSVSSTPWQKFVAHTLEGLPVERQQYERISAPTIKKAAIGIQRALGAFGRTGIGPVDGVLSGVKGAARSVEKQAGLVEAIFDVFMPFIQESEFIFQADAIGRLDAMLPEAEEAWRFKIETLDWRHYWMDIHLPGLARHVYPELESKLKGRRKEVYTPEDLMEVFESSAQNFGERVALQQMTPNGVRRFTYGELRQRAGWVAAQLRRLGMAPGDRLLLMSENRPEWGMAYFGILEAVGTAAPVDAELSVMEVANLTRSAQAFGVVVSPRVKARLERAGLAEALADQPDVRILTLDELIVAPPVEETALVPASGKGAAPVRIGGDAVASLIFTSGTTGRPKGVMLAHRNFTSLLTSINQVFDVGTRDTFLSVLPLHHTFEFTAGFLMPLSRGATVTYLEELNGEALNQAFKHNRITAMIGVPALWQLLHRRITGQVAERGPTARTAFDAMVTLNRWLRDRFKVNLGKTLFAPVHKGLGGNIRYLISGGASLPAPIMETFHGLGFELLEGYGLTEAAPVLTCGRPGDGVRIGSVGRALPGVEVSIKDPDGAGVGEIVARGGNVMLGYFNNEEATEAVLTEDGWLRTGDLGRLDSRGRLYIAGRQKEVIVAANGENVFPDELEEIFGDSEHIEELSVVGLPDHQGSERVACLVRPKLPEDGSLSRDEVIAEIRKHFDLKAVRLPYHQRVKVLRFTDEELPRTATRKIKRKEVVAMLEVGTDPGQEGAAELQPSAEIWGDWGWLRDAAAGLAGIDASRMSRHAALIDDLGFDSLAFTELSAAIERQTGQKISTDELIAAGDLRQIIARIDRVAVEIETQEAIAHPGYSHLPASMRPQEARQPTPTTEQQLGDILELPTPVRASLKSALGGAQRWVYRDLFEMKIHGKAHIPFHTNAIVAANHCSHLDMGLVKSALADWAPELKTLAASDYFFDTKAKRTYFGQLTNLLPVERSGSLEASMAGVVNVINQGQPLLLFPEGTRSTTGDIADFRPGLGYLVLKCRVGVLPVYLGGTYRALPKGAVVPRRRRLKVHIGEMIPFEFFEARTAGMNPREAYLEVARLVREAVAALKAGRRFQMTDEVVVPSLREQNEAAMLTDLFRQLRERFQQDQIDQPVSYYFSLGEGDAGKWTLVVNPQQCMVQPGKPPKADCVVKTTPEMFRKMVSESYVPSMDEFMTGQIKTNDPNLLMAFQNVFGL